MLKAESGLNPYAERWGKGLDVSFGLAQLIVSTANSYGIQGDAYAVREALFDRETSIGLGARHLAMCYRTAGGDWLMSLIVYNSGQMHWPGDWYYTMYAANIAAYERAIEWARAVTATV